MLVDRYSKTIYNLALNFTGNRDDASDITQDIFMKIHTNISKVRDHQHFHSWILKLSKNYCIDYWRKNKKNIFRVELDENISNGKKSPEDIISLESDVQLLRRNLLHLDEELRLVIIMRDIQNQSYEEISENLDLPLGTVKSRINRARAKLAKIFFQQGQ